MKYANRILLKCRVPVCYKFETKKEACISILLKRQVPDRALGIYGVLNNLVFLGFDVPLSGSGGVWFLSRALALCSASSRLA